MTSVRLLEQLTSDNPTARTQFIVLTARAVILSHPTSNGSDESNVNRALAAAYGWEVTDTFDLRAMSYGKIAADILRVITFMRQGLL
jgi:hypothetical protein